MPNPTVSQQVVEGQVYDIRDASARAQIEKISVGISLADDAITYQYKNKLIDTSGTSVTMSGGVPSMSNSASFNCDYVPCNAGDYFTINGTGGSTTRLWAFINSAGLILSKANVYEKGENLIVKAPTNAAFLIVHSKDAGYSFKGKHYLADFVGDNAASGNVSQKIRKPFSIGSEVGQAVNIRSTLAVSSESLKATSTGENMKSFGYYFRMQNGNNAGHKLYYIVDGINVTNVSNVNRIIIDFQASDGTEVVRVEHEPTVERAFGIVQLPDVAALFCVLAGLSTNAVENDWFSVSNIQVYDLTEMFGKGFEPTVEQFRSAYKNENQPMSSAVSTEALAANAYTNKAVQNAFSTVGGKTGVLPTMWEAGGINLNTGKETSTSGHLRTFNYIPVEPGERINYRKPLTEYVLYAIEYETDSQYNDSFIRYVTLSRDRMDSGYVVGANTHYIRLFSHLSNGITREYPPEDAAQKIYLYRDADGTGNVNGEAIMLGLHTNPENQGMLNAIKRARQMTDVLWTPASDIDRVSLLSGKSYSSDKLYYRDVFKAGVTYRGIPYSDKQPFVGDESSIDCFVTAAANPDSVEMQESAYIDRNKASYYGSSCVTLVSYALDLPLRGSEYYQYVDGVDKLFDIYSEGTYHSLETLKLCDILLRSTHASIVTDIIRDKSGNVTHIEVSESTKYGGMNLSDEGSQYGGICRRKMWTVSEFRAWFSDFGVYRYSGLSEVPYKESLYANVPGDGNANMSDKLPIIPYKGNWAFYYSNGQATTVTLLVASTGFTHVRVQKNGVNYGNLIQISGETVSVSCGAEDAIYTAYLCNVDGGTETTTSYPCEWAIVGNDVSHSATVSGSNITFEIVRTGNVFMPIRVEYDGNGVTAAKYSRIKKGSVTVTSMGGGNYKYAFTVTTTHTDYTKYQVRWDAGRCGTVGNELVNR